VSQLQLTYVGGPTALLDFGGMRLLTDPTFDPGGSEYRTPIYVLRKTQGPAVDQSALGTVDVVLLSHEHHFDNLDHEGRRFAQSAPSVLTTPAGAARLGERAAGLEPWQRREVQAADGRVLRITATPARHGPAGSDRGPVIGFVLEFADGSEPTVYVSGDTVWYDGVAEVASRFRPDVAIPFAGAARVPEVGPAHLTFTAAETVIAAQAFPAALIVPLHFEGWEHFSESRGDIERAFAAAGLTNRLRLPVAGQAIAL
jgi:L-ascorbate metabolism protein UlaG (beta-lactamase superfamily)